MKTLLGIVVAALVQQSMLLSQVAAEHVGGRPYDVIAYDWSVTLAFEESPGPDSVYRNFFSQINQLEAEARISIRNIGPTPLEEIPLLFNRLLEPSAIAVEGEAQSFQQELRGLEGNKFLQINHVRVSLARRLDPGAQVELLVRYGGRLMGYPEAGMLYLRENLDPDFTILRSETFCYPRVANPTADDARWAARQDVFDQKLKVTVPAGHIAVNGGRSLGTDRGESQVTYSFASYEPEGEIQIAIAPYRAIEVGDHRIFHFSESEEGAQRLAVQLGKAMPLLQSWFGPPPSERGLTIAEIPEFFGSQARALIIQTSGAFNDPRKYSELYHELSHLWNPPDIDVDPSRWNEGLATLLGALIDERLSGQESLDEELEAIFARLKKRLESDESLHGVAMMRYGEMQMTGFSYSTGALFFGLLRDAVGEAELLSFLARYSRDHRSSGSHDTQFAVAMTAELGEPAKKIVERFFLTSDYVGDILQADSWDQLRERTIGVAGDSKDSTVGN